jgi:hypothetical protein
MQAADPALREPIVAGNNAGGVINVPANALNDPTISVRAQLREAVVSADLPRLQVAVEQAERLGLEREAAHGRKKLATMLAQWSATTGESK